MAAVSKRIGSFTTSNSVGGIEISHRDITAAGRNRPWIAAVAQWRKGFSRIPVPYLHALELAGGTARVLSAFSPAPDEEIPEGLEASFELDPLDPGALEGACGLLIPGGGDIDPALYRSTRHPRTHSVSNRRDRFEMTLLEAALDQDMPVLAICHGMQLMNVYLGGRLVQHLADDPKRLDHDRDRPRAEPAHSLLVKQGSFLEQILGTHNTPVNSHHHQGLDGAAPPLVEVAWAEDGVLEAVESPDHTWVVGVQWHPEAMAPVDQTQLRIFESFVAAAASYHAEAPRTLEARSA